MPSFVDNLESLEQQADSLAKSMDALADRLVGYSDSPAGIPERTPVPSGVLREAQARIVNLSLVLSSIQCNISRITDELPPLSASTGGSKLGGSYREADSASAKRAY